MRKLICCACKEEKDETLFSIKKNTDRGRSYKCKACHNKYCKDTWYPKNRETVIAQSFKWKKDNEIKSLAYVLKISIEEAEKFIKRGRDSCDICGGTTKLAFDHCHTTGKARGVLCFPCNNLLGRLGDSVESIEKYCTKLTDYLKQNSFGD